MNRDRVTRWLLTTFGLFLLTFSLCILNKELSRYNPQDIVNSLANISDRQLIGALFFSIVGCGAIGCYDLIAFKLLKHHLKFKQILFASFLTYAVSNTTGFTLLIGGGIRYRFYSLWGVPAKSIAKIIALGNITFWLGVLSLTGMAFIFKPLQLPNPLSLDLLLIRCLGIVALALVGIYLSFCYQRKCLKIKKKKFKFPPVTISISQILLFSLDWALAAAILYCLIPNYLHKTYFHVFNIYLLAMTASIMSNVPGGLGVFETVVIFLLPKTLSTPDILSSLLVYRAIRFLLPLAIALFFFGYFEIKRRWQFNKK